MEETRLEAESQLKGHQIIRLLEDTEGEKIYDELLKFYSVLRPVEVSIEYRTRHENERIGDILVQAKNFPESSRKFEKSIPINRAKDVIDSYFDNYEITMEDMAVSRVEGEYELDYETD